ncbi:MerR family transcriptional regulator [Paenibacillus wynnii]|uniref:Transcriptional regulator n=1 Tax=Paenibacillus wynnii TaxID=268407 RepID=A0A098M2A0_9BACL|nr:MerR family transcriptional regulator [Paenibacillus wynnii]KGE16354.1 transcriptional regulator [Paenibacillus wynnii]
MKEFITISELSTLMNVSVHQIRYFEEKEILFPAYTDSNKYRMYGIPEIYQLSHILLLRKLNVPVVEIKECMASFSPDDYHQLLSNSLKKVQSQMDQLIMLQQFMQKIVKEHDEFASPENHYQIKLMEDRHLKQWIRYEIQHNLNARNLYENRPKLPDLFEADLHYIYDSNQINLCYEVTAPSDILLEKGNYLYKHLLVSSEQDIEDEFRQLEHYLMQHQDMEPGQIILLEKSYLSMFNNHKLHYEIQVRIS